MIKSITFFFDDNTRVNITGDADKISELIRPRTDIKGFQVFEQAYPFKEPGTSDWDLKALKKLLEGKD